MLNQPMNIPIGIPMKMLMKHTNQSTVITTSVHGPRRG